MDELKELVEAACVPLRGRRGNSFLRIFTVRTGKDGPRISLTGLSGVARFFEVPSGPLKLEVVVTVDQSATGGTTTGDITVTLTSDETNQLTLDGIWELELTDGTSAFVKTLAEGPTDFNSGGSCNSSEGC